MPVRSFLLCLFALLSTSVADAQSVISNHAGLILIAEGSVSVDGQPLHVRKGRFPQLGNGSELTTAEGRAEVLLSPDVFLWLGRKSIVRLENNSLTDTRLELLEGAVIVGTRQPPAGNTVTVAYRGTLIQPRANTLHRIGPRDGGQPDELDQWAHERLNTIRADYIRRLRQAARADHKGKHAVSTPRAYPSPVTPLPGRY